MKKKKYEVAQFKTKTKKTLAEAQAYENQKLVSAGLTPQEKAEWQFKTTDGVAAELKMLQLPTTYISGGGSSNNNSNLLEPLLGAESIKNMMNKPQ